MLVALTTFAFLHDWRGTVIACVAIPTSIVSTFVLMRAMGYTLNNFTMLGLVFSVGIVIDDAIVVLENIHRTMEEKGWEGKRAASYATREIALAVMAEIQAVRGGGTGQPMSTKPRRDSVPVSGPSGSAPSSKS